MRVGIVGGGIAGLTCAAFLKLQGHDCDVFERYAFADTTGAGIQLSPNATRILIDLGLANQLREIGSEPHKLVWINGMDGKEIQSLPLRETLRRHSDSPYLQVLRSDLIEVLTNFARRLNIQLHENCEITGIQEFPESITLSNHSDRQPFDLVVGADGSHSLIRNHIVNAPKPEFAGDIAYRTLIPLSDTPSKFKEPVIRLWVGRHRHVVTYPLVSRSVLNCVFVVSKVGWQEESWRLKGSKTDLLQYFGQWHKGVLELIETLDENLLFVWGLHEHPMLKPSEWHGNRIVLIGDAAHVLLPYLAQGGAAAIEDSAVLASSIVSNDLCVGLRRFASLRSKRTHSMTQGSRRNRYVYHLTWPLTTIRDLLLPLAFERIVRSIYLSNDHAS